MFEKVSAKLPAMSQAVAQRVASERIKVDCEDCRHVFEMRIGDIANRVSVPCPECEAEGDFDDETADQLVLITCMGVLAVMENNDEE